LQGMDEPIWNETIKLFRGGMPLKRHWAYFRSYDNSFTGSEAVDWLHELLKRNHNFGPEVTRYQTLQLLRKFMKNHVVEDVKGRYGKEDFEDSGQVYRFPPTSPLKPLPQRTPVSENCDLPRLIRWDDYEELPQPEKIPMKSLILVRDTERGQGLVQLLQRVLGLKTMDGVLDPKHVNAKHIIHNVFSVNKTGIVIVKNKAEDMPYWVLSAMKCLANWPNGRETKQPMYPGFERDVLRTVAEYFQRLKEPLLTFQLYEVFVNILSLLQQKEVAAEALQVCSLLLPPANRRRLQLLLRLMARVCQNPALPPLNDAIATRTLMVQTFSRCILGSAEEVDLDELLATKLVTFMMEHHDSVLRVPSNLHRHVDDHLSHLRRVQIKYAGADTDASLVSPSYCRKISRAEFEEQRVSSSQGPMQELLEGLIADTELSAKDKRKRLKQFQKSYPEIYRRRFPTAESKAAVLPEKAPRLKPQLVLLTLKKPFQPFQRSWSFRT
uniref:DEP domain containing 1B n=1 Tax=Oncorhynchus tshawytscha TaxID=74940 RepID=A0AAZ3SNR0_ONCTS